MGNIPCIVPSLQNRRMLVHGPAIKQTYQKNIRLFEDLEEKKKLKYMDFKLGLLWISKASSWGQAHHICFRHRVFADINPKKNEFT